MGNETRLSRLVGNTRWLLVDHILRLGLGLFVSVWIARSWVVTGSAYTHMPMPWRGGFPLTALRRVVVRDLKDESLHQAEILRTVFVLKLAGSVAAAVRIAAVMVMRPNDPEVRFFLAIVVTCKRSAHATVL